MAFTACSNTSHLRDVGKLLSNETDSTEWSLIELITLLNKLTLLNYISILALWWASKLSHWFFLSSLCHRLCPLKKIHLLACIIGEKPLRHAFGRTFIRSKNVKFQCYLSKDLIILCQLQDRAQWFNIIESFSWLLHICWKVTACITAFNKSRSFASGLECSIAFSDRFLWKYNPNPLIKVNSCFLFEQIGPLQMTSMSAYQLGLRSRFYA